MMSRTQSRSQNRCRRASSQLVVVAGLALLAAMPAWGVTTYQNVATTSSSFSTEAGNSGVVLGSLMTFATLDLNDVGGTGVTITPLIGTASLNGTSILNSSGASDSGFQITITNPIAAFGFEFTNSSTSGMNYCIQVDGGGCLINDFLSSPQTPFFGWVEDTSFTGTVTITKLLYSGSLQINNFQVGTLGAATTTAPEPGTLFLMGGTLILFPLLSRRYRRRQR